jgi:hypothetical protein
MDAFLIFRAVVIGFVWAGTVYLTMAFIFMMFPMPTYFWVYSNLRNLAQKQQQKSAAQGVVWFDRRLTIMRFLGWVLWLAIIGVYIYSFRPILGYYIIPNHPDFLKLYAIAVALPSLWFLWRAARTMRSTRQKEQAHTDKSALLYTKSLIEQIEGK